jgi:hypothetical protein
LIVGRGLLRQSLQGLLGVEKGELRPVEMVDVTMEDDAAEEMRL